MSRKKFPRCESLRNARMIAVKRTETDRSRDEHVGDVEKNLAEIGKMLIP